MVNRRNFLAGTAAAVAASRRPGWAERLPGAAAPPGTAARGPRVWQASALGAVRPEPDSDLGIRTKQNFARLQDDIYRPPLVFRQTNWKSWPGDFEGRALLAVTLLSRATGEPPPYFGQMVAAYPPQWNAQGYFGPALDRAAINEQQLSGHGWFLRALCELFEDPAAPQTREQTLGQLRALARTLALPLRGAYAAYPIDPAVRGRAAAATSPGAVDGHLSGQRGDWVVSSDTGCCFIFLDGLTHAWVVLRGVGDSMAGPLKELIDEAIARFAQMDLVAIKAQTHATLTALRAVMRVYGETGDPALLKLVKTRYELYRSTAMTEHYANFNWFGRPESWTEPCAIIDSYMVATQIWQHTGEAGYLEDAHRIWFNAVGRGLRANGGFGTDTCPGVTPFVRVRSYEAYFCCTMRGGEGHARAAESLYFTRPGVNGAASEVAVPFFENSTATLELPEGQITLRQRTTYPYGGEVGLEVVSSTVQGPIRVRMLAPEWTSKHRVVVAGAAGKALQFRRDGGFVSLELTPAMKGIELEFDLRVGAREPISAVTRREYVAFEAGPLVLGYAPAENPGWDLKSPNPAEIRLSADAELVRELDEGWPGRYRVANKDHVLRPINDLHRDIHGDPQDRQEDGQGGSAGKDTKAPHPRQVLFRG